MADDVLQYTVHVDGVAYHRGTTPPADVAKKITNPNVWGGPVQAAAPAAGALTLTTAVTQTVTEDPDAQDDAGQPAYPEGLPDDTWTVKDLRAWSKAQELVLGEAKTKDQILEVIAAHLASASAEADPAQQGTDTEDSPTED